MKKILNIKKSYGIVNRNINIHNILINSQKIEIINKVSHFSSIIIKAILKKKKLLIIGNGGSAADSQHFATELTVRLKKNRKALPALSLVTDTSALTAIGNDFSFQKIFTRQIEALGNAGDVVIAISTSGNSENILDALKYCQNKRLKTLCILGNKGGKAIKYSNDFFIVNCADASRVQEIHIIFWQNICEVVENFFSNKNNVRKT